MRLRFCVAQLTLRADSAAIADQKHADHLLRVDRGSPPRGCSVGGRFSQCLANKSPQVAVLGTHGPAVTRCENLVVDDWKPIPGVI
jgi:hypothetical protein